MFGDLSVELQAEALAIKAAGSCSAAELQAEVEAERQALKTLGSSGAAVLHTELEAERRALDEEWPTVAVFHQALVSNCSFDCSFDSVDDVLEALTGGAHPANWLEMYWQYADRHALLTSREAEIEGYRQYADAHARLASREAELAAMEALPAKLAASATPPPDPLPTPTAAPTAAPRHLVPPRRPPSLVPPRLQPRLMSFRLPPPRMRRQQQRLHRQPRLRKQRLPQRRRLWRSEKLQLAFFGSARRGLLTAQLWTGCLR